MTHRIILALTLSLGLAAAALAQPCATMKYGWTHTFGAEQEEWGNSIAVGDGGEIYLGGFFDLRVDFNPSPKRADWHETNGLDDAFYTFYDGDGRQRWTGTVGGTSFDSCQATLLFGNRLFLGGTFEGPVDLNPKRREDVHVGQPGFANPYLTCLGVDRRYHWTRTIDCSTTAILYSIAADSTGNPVSSGSWNKSADFNPGRRRDVRQSNGREDVFVWKLDSRGKYQWVHAFGGALRDASFAVAVDKDDNIYVAGAFTGDVDFDPRGKGDVHPGRGEEDAYLTSLSPKGKVRWTWTVGSVKDDEAWGVAVGPNNRVYVTGYVTGDADFDARGAGDFRPLQGAADCFLTSFTSDGVYLGTHILAGAGGQGSVIPREMAVDTVRGTLAIGGAFTQTVDFDPGPDTDLRTSRGNWDAFAVLLGSEGQHVESFSVGGADHQDWLQGVQFDNEGNLLVTGWFQSSIIDLNPCEGEDVRNRTGNVWPDAFLSKYLCSNCN